MYRVIRLDNGKYQCLVRYRDGDDSWTEEDLDTAIKAIVGAVWIWDRIHINRSDIRIHDQVPTPYPNLETGIKQPWKDALINDLVAQLRKMAWALKDLSIHKTVEEKHVRTLAETNALLARVPAIRNQRGMDGDGI